MGEQEIVRSTRGLKNRRRKGRAGLLKKVTICLASIICCLSFVAVGVLASLTDLPVVIDNDVYYYATAFNKNDSDEFIIENYEDLVMMSNLVNNGVKIPDTNISYQDAKYVVTKDINPKNGNEDNATYALNPIGTSSYPFRGVFNGNGYTISNVTITQTAGTYYVGLFGYAEGAEIYGVGVGTVASPKSCTYSFSVNQTGSFAYGGIVGYAKANAEGTLTSVHDCYNYADISVTVASGISPTLLAVGGIVGNSDGCSIVNCYNTGDITASKQGATSAENIYTAGISCLLDATSATQSSVSNCYNLGTITGVSSSSGSSNSASIALGTGTKTTGTANYTIENCLQTSGTVLELYTNVEALDIADMSGEDALTNSLKMSKLNTDLGQNHWSACCDTEDEYKFPQLLIFEKTYTSDTDEANHTDYYNHYGIIKTIEIKSFHNFLYDPYGCDRYYHNSTNKGGNKLTIVGTTINNSQSDNLTNIINSTCPNADSISNWRFQINSTLTITATPVTGFEFVGFVLVQGSEDCSSNFFTVSGSTVTRYAGATSGDTLATDGVINFVTGENTLTLTAKRSGNNGVMVYDGKEYHQVFALFTPKSYTCDDLAGKFSMEVQDGENYYNIIRPQSARLADITQSLFGANADYIIVPTGESYESNNETIYTYQPQKLNTDGLFYFSDYAGSASYDSSNYHTIRIRSNIVEMIVNFNDEAPPYIFDGFYNADWASGGTQISAGTNIDTYDYYIDIVQSLTDSGDIVYHVIVGNSFIMGEDGETPSAFSQIVLRYKDNTCEFNIEICTFEDEEGNTLLNEDGSIKFDLNNKVSLLAGQDRQVGAYIYQPIVGSNGSVSTGPNKFLNTEELQLYINTQESSTSTNRYIRNYYSIIEAKEYYGYEFCDFYLRNNDTGEVETITMRIDSSETEPSEDGSSPTFAAFANICVANNSTIYVVYRLKTTSITINSVLTDELNNQTISVTKDSEASVINNFINTFGYFHVDQMWYEIYTNANGSKTTRVKADYEEKSATLEVTGITSYGKVFFNVTAQPGYKLEGIYTSSDMAHKYNFSISELEGTSGDYIVCLNGEKIYAKIDEESACTTLDTNEIWLNFVPDNTTVNIGTAYEFEDEIGKYVAGNGQENMFGGTVSVNGYTASYQGVTAFPSVNISGSAMPVGVLVANTTSYIITLTAEAKQGFNFVGFFGLSSDGGAFVEKSTLDNSAFYPSTIANTETLKLLNTSSQEYGTRISKDATITCTATDGNIIFDGNNYTAIYALFERAEVTITAFLHSQRGTEECSSKGGFAVVSGPSTNNTIVANPNLSTYTADGTCAEVSFKIKYREWFKVTPTAATGYKFVGYFATQTQENGDAEINLDNVGDYYDNGTTKTSADWNYNVLLRAILPNEEIDSEGKTFYQNQAMCIAVPCLEDAEGAFLYDGVYYTYETKGSSKSYDQLYARFEKIPIDNFVHTAYGTSGVNNTHSSTMNTNTKEVIGNTTLEYASGRFDDETSSTYGGENDCICISLKGDVGDNVIIYAEPMYGFHFVGFFYYINGGGTPYSMPSYLISYTDENENTTTKYYAGSESVITTFQITSTGIASAEVAGGESITQLYAVYKPISYNFEYEKNDIDINGNTLICYDSNEGVVKSGSDVVTFNKSAGGTESKPEKTSHAYATPGSALSSNSESDTQGYYTAIGYTFIGWGYYDAYGNLQKALIWNSTYYEQYETKLTNQGVSAFKTNELNEYLNGEKWNSLADDLFPASGSITKLKALWVPNNEDGYRGKTYLVLHSGGDCDITTYTNSGMFAYGYAKQIPLVYGATLVIGDYQSAIESAYPTFFTHNSGFAIAGFSIDGGAVVHYGLSDFIYLDSENITITDNKNKLLLNITSDASADSTPASHPFCTIETLDGDTSKYIHLYAVFKKTINFYQGTVSSSNEDAFIDNNSNEVTDYGTIRSYDYLFDYTITGSQTLDLPTDLEYDNYFFKDGSSYIGGVVAMSDIMTSSSAPYTYNESNSINGSTTTPNFLNTTAGKITHGTTSVSIDVCLIYAKTVTGYYITGINEAKTAYSTLSETKTYYYYKLLSKQEISDPFDAKTIIDSLGVNLSFYGYNSNCYFYPSTEAPRDMLTTTSPYNISLIEESINVSGVYVGSSKVKVIGPPTKTNATDTALMTLITQNKTYTFSDSNFVDFDTLASLTVRSELISNTNIYFSPMYINSSEHYNLILPTVLDASFGMTLTEKDYYSFDGWATKDLLSNGWYTTDTANSGKLNYWFYYWDYNYEFSDGTIGREHYVTYNNTPENISASEVDEYKIFVLPGTTLSLYPVFRYHEVSAGFTDDQTTLIFDNSSGLELTSFGYTYGSISNRWTYSTTSHTFNGYIQWKGVLQNSGITFRIKNTTSSRIYFKPNYSYTSTNGVYLTSYATYKIENSSTTYSINSSDPIVLLGGVAYDFTFRISDVGNASGSSSDYIQTSLKPQWNTSYGGTYSNCFKEPEVTRASQDYGVLTPIGGSGNYEYHDGYINIYGTRPAVEFYIENDFTELRYYTIEILDKDGNDVSSSVTIEKGGSPSSNMFALSAGQKVYIKISYSGTLSASSAYKITPYGGIMSGHKFQNLFSLVSSSGGVKEGSTVSFVSGYTANANTNGKTTSWVLTNAQTGVQYPIYTNDNYSESIIADPVCVTVKNIHPAYILLTPTLVESSDKEIIFNINNGANGVNGVSFIETRTSNSTTTEVSALTLTAYGDINSNTTTGLDGRVYLTSSSLTYYITAQKTNCKFLGWYTEPEGGVKILDSDGKFNTANGCKAVVGYIDDTGRWNTANTINLYAHYSPPEYVLVICNNNYDCSIAAKHDHSTINISSIGEIPSANITSIDGFVESYVVDGIVDYRVYFIENDGYYLTRTGTPGNYTYTNKLANITQPIKTSWTFTGFKYIGLSDFEISIFTDLSVPSDSEARMPSFKPDEEHPVIYATWTPIYIKINLSTNIISPFINDIRFGGGKFPDGSTSKTIYILKEGATHKMYLDAGCTTELTSTMFKDKDTGYIPTKQGTNGLGLVFDHWGVFTANVWSTASVTHLSLILGATGATSTDLGKDTFKMLENIKYQKGMGAGNNAVWYYDGSSKEITLFAVYKLDENTISDFNDREYYVLRANYGTNDISILDANSNVLYSFTISYNSTSPYNMAGISTIKKGNTAFTKIIGNKASDYQSTASYLYYFVGADNAATTIVTEFVYTYFDSADDTEDLKIHFYAVIHPEKQSDVYIFFNLSVLDGSDFRFTYSCKTFEGDNVYVMGGAGWYYDVINSSDIDSLYSTNYASEGYNKKENSVLSYKNDLQPCKESTLNLYSISTDAVKATVVGLNSSGSAVKYYPSLSQATSDLSSQSTITTLKLLGNISETSVVGINKTVTIDGNGKTLTISNNSGIKISCKKSASVIIKNIKISCSSAYSANLINAQDLSSRYTSLQLIDCVLRTAGSGSCVYANNIYSLSIKISELSQNTITATGTALSLSNISGLTIQSSAITSTSKNSNIAVNIKNCSSASISNCNIINSGSKNGATALQVANSTISNISNSVIACTSSSASGSIAISATASTITLGAGAGIATFSNNGYGIQMATTKLKITGEVLFQSPYCDINNLSTDETYAIQWNEESISYDFSQRIKILIGDKVVASDDGASLNGKSVIKLVGNQQAKLLALNVDFINEDSNEKKLYILVSDKNILIEGINENVIKIIGGEGGVDFSLAYNESIIIKWCSSDGKTIASYYSGSPGQYTFLNSSAQPIYQTALDCLSKPTSFIGTDGMFYKYYENGSSGAGYYRRKLDGTGSQKDSIIVNKYTGDLETLSIRLYVDGLQGITDTDILQITLLDSNGNALKSPTDTVDNISQLYQDYDYCLVNGEYSNRIYNNYEYFGNLGSTSTIYINRW